MPPPIASSRVALLLLLGALGGAAGAEFSARVVDGLGRPVADVRVEVYCARPAQGNRTLHFQSSADGMVRGSYDPASCKPNFVQLEKEGYQSSSSPVRDRYVVLRLANAREVSRVAALSGDEQQRELRELLAGAGPDTSAVLYHEARLRPALPALAQVSEVAERARDLLGMIGVGEDLRLLARLDRPQEDSAFGERRRYMVATALVDPADELEWAFLRRCASGEFNDLWVDAGAIQTLKLTASPRSRAVLEEARIKNGQRVPLITKALGYIGSKPAPLADKDLKALAERVAQVIQLGSWEGNGPPSFNEAGDQALVDFTFHTEEDMLIYTATFHRSDGVWKLRGVRETLQAFAPPVPSKKK